jgi:nitric-oxide synthase
MPLPPSLAENSNAAPAAEIDIAEAEEFVRLHHEENHDLGPVEDRLAEVHAEIAATGTYRHTTTELTFGARVAWRNSARCIGRLYWRSLKVRDLRDLHDPKEVADECVEHLRVATNAGKIRPVMTVFAPDEPGHPGPRIRNEQLIRYAAYRGPDGGVLGDRRNLELTDLALSRGWQPPRARGPFDVLPVVVETEDVDPSLVDLPPDAVLEVPLSHPELPWLAKLGLRWHAVPVISNMRMRIGGIDYPAAPFNGWYMGTEIGARNLADTDRYDLLPYLAKRMGLDTSSEQTLWRDRALVELNRAVLHSFAEAGVTITDHHTESQRFLTHVQKEEAAGRTCPADWSWIVPPMSGSLTPVFHRYYDKEEKVPNFFPGGTTGVCPVIH